MHLTDRPVTDLLAAFRSPEPAPGGGSAAALAGALGASLIAMVASLPKSRASSDDESARLARAAERCTALSDTLAALVDRDTEAYNAVMAAFRLPKGSDEEKRARSARIQEATRDATDTPLAVMRACADALEQAPDVAALGNPNAASDLQVGLELLTAAARGAGFNVEINLGSLKDADYVARTRAEAARLLAEGDARTADARQALG